MYLRKMRLTISRNLARTLSREDQSTLGRVHVGPQLVGGGPEGLLDVIEHGVSDCARRSTGLAARRGGQRDAVAHPLPRSWVCPWLCQEVLWTLCFNQL